MNAKQAVELINIMAFTPEEKTTTAGALRDYYTKGYDGSDNEQHSAFCSTSKGQSCSEIAPHRCT